MNTCKKCNYYSEKHYEDYNETENYCAKYNKGCFRFRLDECINDEIAEENKSLCTDCIHYETHFNSEENYTENYCPLYDYHNFHEKTQCPAFDKNYILINIYSDCPDEDGTYDVIDTQKYYI